MIKQIALALCMLCTSLTYAQVGGGPGDIGDGLPDVITADLVNPTLDDGCNNGEITLSILGGEGDLSYTWSGPDGDSDQSSRSQLSEGEHCVTVTDESCSEASTCFELNCTDIFGDYFEIEVLNDCGEGGSISVVSSYINPPINWTLIDENGLIQEGVSSNESFLIEGLNSNVYSLELEIGSGATFEKGNLQINEYNVLQLSTAISLINPSSCTSSDGQIYVAFPHHGLKPLTYSWSNGESTESLTNLSAGEYTLTLTDANGCFLTESFLLDGNGQPYVGLTEGQISCPGMDNGTLLLFGTSTVDGLLEVVWDDGPSYLQDTDFFQHERVNLAPGTYCYTVTDQSNGCSVSGCTEVLEVIDADELILKKIKIQDACNFGDNGYITYNVEGGVRPLTYSWNTGSSERSLFGIPPGTYTVTITDYCESILEVPFEVGNHFSEINIDPVIQCFSDESGIGSINLNPSGSNMPFTYYWSSLHGGAEVVVDEPGDYHVKITDANGCVEDFVVPVALNNIPLEVEIIESALNADDFGDVCTSPLSVEIRANVVSGFPPFTFQWSGNNITLSEEEENVAFFNWRCSDMSFDYGLKVTDACGNTNWSSGIVDCNAYCQEDCFEVSVDASLDIVSKQPCVDPCDELDWFGCAQISIASICDDGIPRTVTNWSKSNRTVKFIGTELDSGDPEYDLNQTTVLDSDLGAWYFVPVINDLTGCRSHLQYYLPPKCFHLGEWLYKIFGPGNPSSGSNGGGGSSSSCPGGFDVSDLNCATFYDCFDDPSLDYVEYNYTKCWYETIDECCETYTLVNVCEETCNVVSVLATNIMHDFNAPECNSCISGFAPSNPDVCDENAVSLTYDPNSDEFIYLGLPTTDDSYSVTGTKDKTELLVDIMEVNPRFNDLELLDIKIISDSSLVLIAKEINNRMTLFVYTPGNIQTIHTTINCNFYHKAEIINIDELSIKLIVEDENRITSQHVYNTRLLEYSTTTISSQSTQNYVFSKNNDHYLGFATSNGNTIINTMNNGQLSNSINVTGSITIKELIVDKYNRQVVFFEMDSDMASIGDINISKQDGYNGCVMILSENEPIKVMKLYVDRDISIEDVEYDEDVNIGILIETYDQEDTCVTYHLLNIETNEPAGLQPRSTLNTQKKENSVVVSPNPFSDLLLLEFGNKLTEEVKCKVISNDGKLMEEIYIPIKTESYQFSTINYLKGVYVLKLEFPNGEVINQKIIKL